MFIMVRSSKSVTGGAIRTFSSISGTDTFEFSGTINLVDSAKQPLLGSSALTGRDMRGRSSAFHTPSYFSSAVPVYFIYFTDDFINAVANEVNKGFLYLNGQQYLQITPGSTFTTGTYVIDVWVNMYSCLSQIKGILSKTL
jgi:hypothetical protein